MKPTAQVLIGLMPDGRVVAQGVNVTPKLALKMINAALTVTIDQLPDPEPVGIELATPEQIPAVPVNRLNGKVH